ncbi:MAG: OmpA family [Rickettsiaceae bacterium]|jgi:outer membrane protein OmpA-like peptidoglycan-associated protein|nr:OmpA family [Rickettsiaceae bacterium]
MNSKFLGMAILAVTLSACVTHKHAVYFGSGGSKLDKEDKLILAQTMKEVSLGQKITLTGFTDKQGGTKTNIKLADKRVAAVNAELIKMGVSPKKIRLVSSSDSSIDKAVSNLGEARRVELLVK